MCSTRRCQAVAGEAACDAAAARVYKYTRQDGAINPPAGKRVECGYKGTLQLGPAS